LHAQDQRGVDELGLAAAALFLCRCVEFVTEPAAVLAAIPRRWGTAPTVPATLELLGQSDEFEMIVARHGAVN
jgi:hypothetical protein